MIEQLKRIRDFVDVIEVINPDVCKLPPRVLLDAADTHVIVGDLIEEIENNKPVINPCDICESNACESCDGMSEFYRPAPEGESNE